MDDSKTELKSVAATPGQRKRADELVALAYKEFEGSLPDGSDLMPGEIKMLRAAAMGELVNLASEPGDETDLEWRVPMRGGPFYVPMKAWGAHRHVRGLVVRWVCASKRAQGLVDPLGVAIEGALVVGKIDLTGANVPFRIILFQCAIPLSITLRHASLEGLYCNGSVVAGIEADGVKVTGTVHLNRGFVSQGEVCLVGATIDGNFSCNDAAFNNATGDSLNADGVKVAGDVNLDRGFVSHGEVRLVGAMIGGNLSCSDGVFNNTAGRALNADNVKVRSDVNLNKKFVSHGEVCFSGATVGGDLSCSEGTFVAGVGYALLLQGASVDGTMIFGGMKVLSGMIVMDNARAGYLLDGLAAWGDRLRLTGFRYRAIHPAAVGTLDDRLKWLAKHDETAQRDGNRFDPQPYRQLAKVLRQSGHEYFANEVMFVASKKQANARFKQLRDKPWFGDWLYYGWIKFLEYLIGFGYRRWLPILWLVGFIWLGSFVFSGGRIGDAFGDANPNPPAMQQTQGLALKNSGESWVDKYPAFRPIAYSADAFLPLVNLHQETYWTPKDGWVKWFYLPFHILMGWIVTTLAAVSVTGLVRHEKE